MRGAYICVSVCVCVCSYYTYVGLKLSLLPLYVMQIGTSSATANKVSFALLSFLVSLPLIYHLIYPTTLSTTHFLMCFFHFDMRKEEVV